MKFKGFPLLIAIIVPAMLGTAPALAQDEALTPEQQEAVRETALAINDECPMPAQPPIPDGSTATRDDMVTSQQELQAYINDGDAYLGCLESMEQAWGDDITDTQSAVVDTLYNRTVGDLQSSADAFNAQLKIYQEASAE